MIGLHLVLLADAVRNLVRRGGSPTRCCPHHLLQAWARQPAAPLALAPAMRRFACDPAAGLDAPSASPGEVAKFTVKTMVSAMPVPCCATLRASTQGGCCTGAAKGWCGWGARRDEAARTVRTSEVV